MLAFDFTIGNFVDAISCVPQWLKNKSANNSIHFDETAGKGHFLIAELTNGLFVRATNYTIKENTRFNIRPAGHNSSPVFMISCLLMPESFLISAGEEWPEKLKRVNQLHNIIFSTSRTEFSFIVKAGQQAKAFDICFTLEWLLQQFPAGKSEELKRGLAGENNGKPLLVKSFSIDDYKVVSEIVDSISRKEVDNIFLQSRVLTLMSSLVSNILLKHEKKETLSTGNVQTIMKIEHRLNSIMHDKLPSLKAIAKEFSMSESTLKRQFKQVYGKAVYEYYLEKKMELARHMLSEKNMMVAQVAYSLGYEKASPFIRIFKRHFGISPGSLRTSKMTDNNFEPDSASFFNKA